MGILGVWFATRTDTLIVSHSDSLFVGNWPSALIEHGPNVWVTTVIPILASATLSFFAAHRIYKRQRKDESSDQLLIAFNLNHALCDEMSRARTRIWNIIEEKNNKKHLRGPFVLDAKENILTKLAEVLPPNRNLSTIFRFYELLTLVAVHHNRAASIPDVPGITVLRAAMVNKAGQTKDSVVLNDYRTAEDARRYAYAFALRHYDMEGEESLTSLFINAVEDLRTLAKETGQEEIVSFTIPTEVERSKQRSFIKERMSEPSLAKRIRRPLAKNDETDSVDEN